MGKYILLICYLWIAAGSYAQSLATYVEKGSAEIPAMLYREMATQMRKAVPRLIVPTLPENLRVEVFQPSEPLNQQIDADYLKAIELTNEVIKDTSRRVWYDVHDEMRSMPSLEIGACFTQIAKAKAAVHQAELFLKPGDVPIEQAKTALNFISQYYDMRATGVMPTFHETSVDLYAQAEKIFKQDRFFLSNPVLPPRKMNLGNLFSRPLKLETLPFPKKLRVAVVADLNVLDTLKTVAMREKLTGWQIDAYKTPEIFLNWPNHLSYDLVLTDILIPGGGGIYLTRQLREQKFEGGILAITAYPEEKHIGVKLQMAGMNGMITMSDYIDPYFILRRPETMAQKLRNYFFYRYNPLSAGKNQKE